MPCARAHPPSPIQPATAVHVRIRRSGSSPVFSIRLALLLMQLSSVPNLRIPTWAGGTLMSCFRDKLKKSTCFWSQILSIASSWKISELCSGIKATWAVYYLVYLSSKSLLLFFSLSGLIEEKQLIVLSFHVSLPWILAFGSLKMPTAT